VPEKMVPRRIFKSRRGEAWGGCRKLDNENFYKLQSSSSFIRMIISKRMRWTIHVASMVEI
jgi:hypothetical protein